MSDKCTHPEWLLQREHSHMQLAEGVRRYTCKVCGAWGWRKMKRKGKPLPPIQPYPGPRYEPDPVWQKETATMVEGYEEIAAENARDAVKRIDKGWR